MVKVVPEPDMVEALVEWANRINDEGIEGALTHADSRAQAEADADRAAMLDDRGLDANHREQTIEMIRRHVAES